MKVYTLINRYTGDTVTTDNLSPFDLRVWELERRVKPARRKALLVEDFIATRRYYDVVKSVTALPPKPKKTSTAWTRPLPGRTK